MTENNERTETVSEQQQFVQHLEQASEIVRSWPLWKQAILGGVQNTRATEIASRPRTGSQAESHQ
jgi:hypothetical protein